MIQGFKSRLLASVMSAVFSVITVSSDLLRCDNVFAAEIVLPSPTQMVQTSKAFSYPVLKGLKIDPNNPLNLEFVIDTMGKDKVDEAEAQRLVNYFLTAVAVPQKDLWVNLSPYEKDRVVTDELGATVLGEELLAQDYLLKQLSSSLTDPNTATGKDYWKTAAQTETFKKIWIKPELAQVYENGNQVFVTAATLDIESEDATNAVLLPAIKKEVNEGEHFASIRQAYYSIILGLWFKEKLKSSVFKNYIDKNNVAGIAPSNPQSKEQIFNAYVESFKKGVYNQNVKTRENGRLVKKAYFSGGAAFGETKLEAPKAGSSIVAEFAGKAFYLTGLAGSKISTVQFSRKRFATFVLIAALALVGCTKEKPSADFLEEKMSTVSGRDSIVTVFGKTALDGLEALILKSARINADAQKRLAVYQTIQKITMAEDVGAEAKIDTVYRNGLADSVSEIRNISYDGLQSKGGLTEELRISKFIQDYKRGEGESKKVALNNLNNIGPNAINALVQLMLNGDRDATSMLGQLRNPAAVPALIDKLLAGDSEAALSLGIIADPRAVPSLITVAESTSDQMKIAALTALGMVKDPRAFFVCVGALNDKSREVKVASVTALGSFKDPRAVMPLLDLFQQEEMGRSIVSEGEIFYPIINALVAIGDTRPTPVFLEAQKKYNLLLDRRRQRHFELDRRATSAEAREIMQFMMGSPYTGFFVNHKVIAAVPLLRVAAQKGEVGAVSALASILGEKANPDLESFVVNSDNPSLRNAAYSILKQRGVVSQRIELIHDFNERMTTEKFEKIREKGWLTENIEIDYLISEYVSDVDRVGEIDPKYEKTLREKLLQKHGRVVPGLIGFIRLHQKDLELGNYNAFNGRFADNSPAVMRVVGLLCQIEDSRSIPVLQELYRLHGCEAEVYLALESMNALPKKGIDWKEWRKRFHIRENQSEQSEPSALGMGASAITAVRERLVQILKDLDPEEKSTIDALLNNLANVAKTDEERESVYGALLNSIVKFAAVGGVARFVQAEAILAANEFAKAVAGAAYLKEKIAPTFSELFAAVTQSDPLPEKSSVLILCGNPVITKPEHPRHAEYLASVLRIIEMYSKKNPDFKVVLSGNTGPFNVGKGLPAEAELIEKILLENGVPANRLIIENRSTSTEENAAYTKERLAWIGHEVVNPILIQFSESSRRAGNIFAKEFGKRMYVSLPYELALTGDVQIDLPLMWDMFRFGQMTNQADTSLKSRNVAVLDAIRMLEQNLQPGKSAAYIDALVAIKTSMALQGKSWMFFKVTDALVGEAVELVAGGSEFAVTVDAKEALHVDAVTSPANAGGVDLKKMSIETAKGSSAIELNTASIDPAMFKDGISFKIVSLKSVPTETILAGLK